MRFQIRLIFAFLSLLVIFPVFALNSKPAFAFASHIVRLKYEDGSPVAGKMVILRGGEFNDCEGEWCHDCSRAVRYPCSFDCGIYWTGPTWTATTDSHGLAVLSAKSCSSNTTCGIFEGSIQACSIGRVLRLVMGVAYLNDQGYWRLDNVSNRSGGTDMKDDRPGNCALGTAGCTNCSPDQLLSYNLAGDNEPCMNYWGEEFSYRGFGSRANIAATALPYDEDSMGSPNRKSTNIYWEWTWIGAYAQNSTPQNLAQNPNTQNQPILAYTSNFLNSLKGLFSKITLANNL
ncbi:MAG: hypothetical protein PHV63_04375 [Candidatus Daviesbacteria bacterium]|nr:hypothetical protein [Candidatus Daviesbacteria bacterium]